jgi:hypothetical protein
VRGVYGAPIAVVLAWEVRAPRCRVGRLLADAHELQVRVARLRLALVDVDEQGGGGGRERGGDHHGEDQRELAHGVS